MSLLCSDIFHWLTLKMTAECYCHINLKRHYGNGNSTNYFRARRSELGLKLRNFCLCSLEDMGLGREKMAAGKFYVVHM